MQDRTDGYFREDGKYVPGEGAAPTAALLVADIGNTRVSLGAVQGENVYAQQSLGLDDREGFAAAMRQMWDALPAPRRVVACSVNPQALELFASMAANELDEDVLVVGEDLELPLDVDLPDPAAVGRDRLCCAAAAWGRLGQACVVVDLGTAITVDCVNGDGAFIGGAILPGMQMQLDALHDRTAALPGVRAAEPAAALGTDTVEAMLVGVVAGVRGAVRSLIEAYATQLGAWPPVITTGGDAELFGNPEEIVQARYPALSLLGAAAAFYKSYAPPQ